MASPVFFASNYKEITLHGVKMYKTKYTSTSQAFIRSTYKTPVPKELFDSKGLYVMGTTYKGDNDLNDSQYSITGSLNIVDRLNTHRTIIREGAEECGLKITQRVIDSAQKFVKCVRGVEWTTIIVKVTDLDHYESEELGKIPVAKNGKDNKKQKIQIFVTGTPDEFSRFFESITLRQAREPNIIGMTIIPISMLPHNH